MATINNLPLLTNIVPTRVCIPVTCSTVAGATFRLPLSTVIALGRGNIGYTGSTGGIGPQGLQGLRGFTGSSGPGGFIGSRGSAGPTGPQGMMGYTGSAAGGGTTINLTSVTNPIMPYTSDIVDLGAFNKSWRAVYTNELYVNTSNIKDLQSGLPIVFSNSSGTNTGGFGYTGSVGQQGLRGFSGSTGNLGPTGPAGIGFTGSAGQRGFDGSSAPSLLAGTGISFSTTGTAIIINATANTGTNTRGYTGSVGSTGLTGYNGSAGAAGYTGSRGLTGYNGSAGAAGPTGPAGSGTAITIIPGTGISVNTSGTAVTISATGGGGAGYTGSRGLTGYNGSAGISIYDEDTLLGSFTSLNFVGLAVTATTQVSGIAAVSISGTGGGTGYTGSAGTVNALANGTYTISTLYVNTLTVSSVGAATIQSGNDLNLRAVGQITVNAPFVLTNATTSSLAALSGITQIGAMVFVTNYSGGAQPCYFDGVHWYTVNGRVRVD